MRNVGWRIGAMLVVAGFAAPALVSGGGADPAWAAGNRKVQISHAKFVPQQIEIQAGDTVVWTNEDEDAHSVTADGGAFDSHPGCSDGTANRCLAPGDSWSHTFAEPGRYPYHSRTEGQKGVVVVTGGKG